MATSTILAAVALLGAHAAALGADEVAERRVDATSWTRADAVAAATELVPSLPGRAPSPADDLVLDACVSSRREVAGAAQRLGLVAP